MKKLENFVSIFRFENYFLGSLELQNKSPHIFRLIVILALVCASVQSDDSQSKVLPDEEFRAAPSEIPLRPWWSQWGEWSYCSKTCGPGFKTKTRELRNE